MISGILSGHLAVTAAAPVRVRRFAMPELIARPMPFDSAGPTSVRVDVDRLLGCSVCHPGRTPPKGDTMTYRPYPNADRALRQLERRRSPEPPTEFEMRLARQAQEAMETAGRIVGPVMQNFREGLTRWSEGQRPPVDEYRMSTR